MGDVIQLPDTLKGPPGGASGRLGKLPPNVVYLDFVRAAASGHVVSADRLLMMALIRASGDDKVIRVLRAMLRRYDGFPEMADAVWEAHRMAATALSIPLPGIAQPR